MKTYCTHENCRLDAAADLAWIAWRLDRRDLGVEAVRLMVDNDLRVVCRRVPTPRPGLDGRGTDVPLPSCRGAS